MDNNFDIDDKIVNDIYNSHYLKLPRQLQEAIGLWPFDTDGFSKYIRQTLVFIVMTIMFILLGNGCRIWCGVNTDVCSENVMGIMYMISTFSTYIIILSSQNKMKSVFRTVAKNWVTITDPEEKKIILMYSALGRIKIIGYFIYMAIIAIAFILTPLFPVFLDLLKPLNESRQKVMVLRAEYIINSTDHYYKMPAYMTFIILLNVFVFIGIDGSYTITTHQHFAMLSVVKHRLQTATKHSNVQKNLDYNVLIKATRLHKESIGFNQLIETTYSSFFLLINGFSIAYLSIASVLAAYLFDNFTIDEYLLESIRLILMIFGVLIHLLYFTWSGQLLLSLSEELFVSAYMNEWYNMSRKGKILLKIIMLRFTKPSRKIDGGLYIMNFINYGAMIKSTLSYTIAILFLN